MKIGKHLSRTLPAAFILFFGVCPLLHAQAPVVHQHSPNPPPPAMVINGGVLCTTQTSVTLQASIEWKNEYIRVWQYRASESMDNMLRVPFAPMGGPSVPFSLSTGYGKKTVYLDVKKGDGSIISLSDSIDYKASCLPTHPSFRDLKITLLKKYPERFKLDLQYSFNAARFVNDDTYQIEILVVPDDASYVGASLMPPTTLAYTANQGLKMIQGIEYRSFHGTVTMNAPAQGDLPTYGRLKFIIKSTGGPSRTVKPGLVPLQQPHQASASKGIFLEQFPGLHFRYNRQECTGPVGDGKKTQTHSMGRDGWAYGKSILTLNRAPGSATEVGQTLKFDGNPLPTQGERGVRWAELPKSDQYGNTFKIYWWCEGLSNKNEGGNTYEFRYEVKHNLVRPRIEN